VKTLCNDPGCRVAMTIGSRSLKFLIAIIYWRDTVRLQYHAAGHLQAVPCQRSPTYSPLQQENVGGPLARGEIGVCGVCLTYLVEKALHSIDGLLQL